MAKIRILGQNRQNNHQKFGKKWKIWTKWKIMRKFKTVKYFIKFSKKWPKMAQFWKFLFHHFSHPQKNPETGTSHFHATYPSKDNFSSIISNFSNSNFSRTKKQTGEVKFIFFGFADFFAFKKNKLFCHFFFESENL